MLSLKGSAFRKALQRRPRPPDISGKNLGQWVPSEKNTPGPTSQKFHPRGDFFADAGTLRERKFGLSSSGAAVRQLSRGGGRQRGHGPPGASALCLTHLCAAVLDRAATVQRRGGSPVISGPQAGHLLDLAFRQATAVLFFIWPSMPASIRLGSIGTALFIIIA
jgi:hypothetical protein